MTSGLLDFFILEGSEHVEQLDALLARAQGGAPDAAAFATHARALRGSATMAKLSGIASVAAGLERVARAMRDGRFAWSVGARAAIVAAVDDLKLLIHGVRTWGPAEEQRAAARANELTALAPAAGARAGGASTAGDSYLAAQTAEVADGLAHIAGAGVHGAAGDAAVARVRALRGVAALNDLPPLAEVVAAADEVVKSLELGQAPPSELQRALLAAAADVLREGAQALHEGRRPDPNSHAVVALTDAAEALLAGSGDGDRVVPIATLFPSDGQPNPVHTSPNPPTTPGQRFRMEVVSHAEHLRRLINDAHHAADAAATQRLGHELRVAVRALARAAESFGENAVAMTLQALIEGASLLDRRALATLERATTLLTSAGDEPLAARFEALLAPDAAPPSRLTPSANAVIAAAKLTPPPVAHVEPPQPAHPAQPAHHAHAETAPAATPSWEPTDLIAAAPAQVAAETGALLGDAPSGAALSSLLGAGIAGLSQLDDEPLSQPVAIDEDDGVVPIQDLLYRGKAALRRAIELGDSVKRHGMAPTADTLTELFDLLELAAAE